MATEDEVNELFDIIRQQEHEAVLKNWLSGKLEETDPVTVYDQKRWDTVIEKIVREAQDNNREIYELSPQPKNRRFWQRIAVAASIILTLGLSYWLYERQGTHSDQNEIPVAKVSNDIKAPGNSRAMITLADGRKVYLDSAGKGTLATQGNVQLVKLADGQIAYHQKPESGNQELEYNTLFNPRGSKVVSVTMADGTKVWLNAESSLRYPTAFIGKERKVEITGEAYFEVAPSVSADDGTKKTFIVQKGDMRITVLGTHFNVNAYDDETVAKVTLLEGSVKINSGNTSGLLKPGQQARISSGIKIGDDVDLEEVMAWKNGKFQFGDATDIATIMKQVGRWYDVDIEYKGTITRHIGGTISRFENASQVLKMLEMTGSVSFKIDGKKVIVMPK